jgi:hypothetical protein
VHLCHISCIKRNITLICKFVFTAKALQTLKRRYGCSERYVNGQQVRATLDGLPISWGTMASLMDHGGAIPAALAPYQNLPGFRFESHGLGIFIASVPILAGYGLRTGDGPMAALAGDAKGIKNIFGIAGNNNLTVQRFWLVTDFSFLFGDEKAPKGWDSTKYFKIITEKKIFNTNTNYLDFIDAQKARDFLKAAYDQKCKDAIAKLINKLEEVTGQKQKASTDLLNLFDSVTAHGGFFFNFHNAKQLIEGYNANKPKAFSSLPAGSFAFGYSVHDNIGGYVFLRSGVYSLPDFQYRTAHNLLSTLIHELIHISRDQSGNINGTSTYSDDAFNNKLNDFLTAEKARSFDGYIEDNCKPK